MSYKILYVEDYKNLAISTTILLKSWGYDVDTVDDGCKAFKKATENKYDLIITDNNLPKMSGINFIKNLYDQTSNPKNINSKIPVILTSGELGELSKEDRSLFRLIFSKPWDISKLKISLENILEKK